MLYKQQERPAYLTKIIIAKVNGEQFLNDEKEKQTTLQYSPNCAYNRPKLIKKKKKKKKSIRREPVTLIISARDTTLSRAFSFARARLTLSRFTAIIIEDSERKPSVCYTLQFESPPLDYTPARARNLIIRIVDFLINLL